MFLLRCVHEKCVQPNLTSYNGTFPCILVHCSLSLWFVEVFVSNTSCFIGKLYYDGAIYGDWSNSHSAQMVQFVKVLCKAESIISFTGQAITFYLCSDIRVIQHHTGEHVEMSLPGNVIEIYGCTWVHGQRTHGMIILLSLTRASVPSLQHSHAQYIWKNINSACMLKRCW